MNRQSVLSALVLGASVALSSLALSACKSQKSACEELSAGTSRADAESQLGMGPGTCAADALQSVHCSYLGYYCHQQAAQQECVVVYDGAGNLVSASWVAPDPCN